MKKIIVILLPLMMFCLTAAAGNDELSNKKLNAPFNKLTFENVRFSYTPNSLFDKKGNAISQEGMEALDELVVIAKGQNMDTVEIYIPNKVSGKKGNSWEIAIKNYLMKKGIPEYGIKFVSNILGESPSKTIEINLSSSAIATRK